MIRHLIITICALLIAGNLYASPAHSSGKGVVLNFNEVDIATMVKFVSDLTGKNFVLDDRVKGKISVYSPSKLTIDEAYNVFVSVLELKGFTVVQSGRVIKIVPSSSARQSGFTLLAQGEQAPVQESYVAQVVKLQNITSQEALTFLQPLVSKDGHISAFGPGNLLLMVDSSINVRKLQGILHAIDNERVREGFEIIYLKFASADSAATTIRQWLTVSDAKVSAQPAAMASSLTGNTLASVLADNRLNALLVFGNEHVKKAVREMVAKLDVQPPEASRKVNVCYLENTDATEMAKVLEGVVKGMSAAGVTTGQTGTAGAVQTSTIDSSKVIITADKATNSLVVMASGSDFNTIQGVIKKLDRRSKQVFVQVLIAEVTLDKKREVGMQTTVLGAAALNKYIGGGGFYDPFGVLSSLITSSTSSTTSPITFPISGSAANVGAVLKALDKNGLLNVLSTPNILTTDNKEAEINVGENVPFKGSSTLSTVGTTTSVERKDVGINLKIKPQTSEGDYIRMDISQEISAVKNDSGQAIDLITTKRSAKTSVVVKDKETVIIGGLIQDKEEDVVMKVPFLGDIPGLGWLFKTRTKTRTKTNLMILLTPQIVRDSASLVAVTGEQRVKFGDAAKNVEPVDVQKELKTK